MIIKHRNNAPVRLPPDRAVGIIIAQLPGNHVVVQWPNRTQSKHHAKELKGVA